jgi:hypothetical protein
MQFLPENGFDVHAGHFEGRRRVQGAVGRSCLARGLAQVEGLLSATSRHVGRSGSRRFLLRKKTHTVNAPHICRFKVRAGLSSKRSALTPRAT